MKLKFIFICGLVFISSTIRAQVAKNVYVDKAGTLISQLTGEEANSITHLTLTGKINAIDFRHLRDEFENLQVLDLSNADIRMYAGKEGTSHDKFYVYPPNCIPAYAFCKITNGDTIGKSTLREVILSEKIKNIEDAAFKRCDNLWICQIRKKSAPNLLTEGLADSITAIFIPQGVRDEYRLKKRWENFAFIEGAPVKVDLQIGTKESLREEILKAGLQPKEINFLTVEGKLDYDDLKLIRDYMPNLVSVDISNTDVIRIPDFTFAQKKYMLRIRLPKDLKVIGQRTFSGCGRLSGTIELPATVTTIDYGAFMGCENLKSVIVTGNNLTTVGHNIFGDERSKLVYQ